MKVCISMACWPGLRQEAALAMLEASHDEPVFGRLSMEHIQLVPQTFGTVTDEVVESILSAYPSVRFRLHANARVLPTHRLADLSNFQQNADWFNRAANVSKRLKAPAYSAHSGRRENSTVAQMLDNARRCADLFECPVAVEGQYPAPGDVLLVSTWSEYRTVFESGVPYALDLSHLNIVASRTASRDDGLLHEMLACERCIEIHVSDNDGSGDWHRVCEAPPWWLTALQCANPEAVIFTEGNHRHEKKQ
ncbi:hypothetical protein POK33_39660 [Burkholderia cenocepacia]|uniref:hypothetical protein n=1 Tax=Burkholderia cenocepacia TaxID=95486 RepID=UPI0023B94DEB|nr:hypothetical protein [Burkholderia cenocepacia]MDF0506872.1 hypothetical protein [Burkholderia cenocepacia]